jgi:hypothetical protein
MNSPGAKGEKRRKAKMKIGLALPLFLSVAVLVLVIAASYTPPRPSIESIELPPGPPTDEEMSHWPAPGLMSTDVHTITIGVNALPIWPGRELAAPQLHKGWNDLETLPGTTTDLPIWPGRELWPREVTDERGMAAWAAPAPVYFYALTTWAAPELVTLDLYPGWNLVRNSYVYEGAPQPLFRYLQLWWNLERLLP